MQPQAAPTVSQPFEQAAEAARAPLAQERAEEVVVTPVPMHTPAAVPLQEAPVHEATVSEAPLNEAPAPEAPVTSPAELAPAPSETEAIAAPIEQPAAVPAAPAAPAPVAAEPESSLVHAIQAAPEPAEPAAAAERAPQVAAVPTASAMPAPIEAASAATEVTQRPAALEAAAAPAHVHANGLSIGQLQPMLESAGLVWVNTDAEKLRAAHEAAAQAPAPVRTPRQRKPLPPVDSTPLQQIETHKDA
ncbi:MAG: hypothetical protein KGQ57_16610 [Burkholderiales bacterium]|nr:hypothetical protein [Burkholderiales bacterium]